MCRQGETSKNNYFVKSGKVKIVRDVVFHSPIARYQNVIGNAVFREDPMKAKGYNRFDEYNKPEVHSLQLNQLSTFQSFGAPFSI